MTPEEVSAIKHLGSLVFLNSAVETLNCVLYGIYCLALAIAIYIYYVGNGGIGCAKKKMLCLLLVSFIGVSIVLFIPAAEALVQIEDPLIVSIPGGGIVPSAIVNSELLLEVCSQMSDWVSIIILLTADTVIVWRAWSVWTDNKTVQRILLFSMLANIGVSLADGVADSQLSLNIHDTGHALTLDWVAFMMPLSVNIIATSLIAFQAWEHHKSTKYLSMGKKKTKGEGILLILVESGAVYALFQLLAIIFYILDVNAPSLSSMFTATVLIELLYTYAAVLNPLFIIILVQTQNTYEDSVNLEEILVSQSLE